MDEILSRGPIHQILGLGPEKVHDPNVGKQEYRGEDQQSVVGMRWLSYGGSYHAYPVPGQILRIFL